MSLFRDLKHIGVVIEYCRAEPADPELAALVLALEDKRFFEHCGVDLLALGRAALRLLQGRPNGGASTIDMQLVRTITDRRQRTIARKLREIVVAVLVRRKFGADIVLSAYLRIAYTGYRLTGLQEGAKHLFGRAIEQCLRHEKAMVASSLLQPVPRFPTLAWRERLEARARFALRRDRIAGNRPASTRANGLMTKPKDQTIILAIIRRHILQ